MWVVFISRELSRNDAKGDVKVKDEYSVVETEQEAIIAYDKALELEDLYCAGYAPVKHGTEPHWIEEICKDEQDGWELIHTYDEWTNEGEKTTEVYYNKTTGEKKLKESL